MSYKGNKQEIWAVRNLYKRMLKDGQAGVDDDYRLSDELNPTLQYLSQLQKEEALRIMKEKEAEEAAKKKAAEEYANRQAAVMDHLMGPGDYGDQNGALGGFGSPS